MNSRGHLSLLLLACCLAMVYGGPVIGIDLGSKWYKVAMIQGNNFDLVLDAAGDRRRVSLIGFHGEERAFGRDADVMVRLCL